MDQLYKETDAGELIASICFSLLFIFLGCPRV
jgi:hypothetical protein